MRSTVIRRDYVKQLGFVLTGLLLSAAAVASATGTTTVNPVASPPVAPSMLATAPPNPLIPRPPELERDVRFWVRVYSEITTDQGFLHDQWNLAVVYETLRFPAGSTPQTRRPVVEAARNVHAARLRQLAARLEQGNVPTDALAAEERAILEAFGSEATPARLRQAATDVRFQLGQADRFRAGIVRSGAWESHIADTLANKGLPPELAALPHVESSFTPTAYSKVGAAGLWQFMRSTGRRYMRIDDAVDERLDPFRSTEAAAQLLAYNYRVLGTWPLALTAYNHGAGGLRRAKEELGTDDFVTIARKWRGRTFGFASRNFYPSFLAALEIDRNPEKYFGEIRRAPEERFLEVRMPGYVEIGALVRAVDVPTEILRDLNPALRPPVWSGNRLVPRNYRLRLPAGNPLGTEELLAQRLGPNELFASQIQERSHRVRAGETLASIARRHGLSTRTLAQINGLAPDQAVRRGRVLRLPTPRPPLLAATAAVAAEVAAEAAAPVPAPGSADGLATVAVEAPRTYVVRAGDTLAGIAQRFSVSPRELMRINRLRDADFLFEGQRLWLSAPAAATAALLTPERAATATPAVATTVAEDSPGTAVVAPELRGPARRTTASTGAASASSGSAVTPAGGSADVGATPAEEAAPTAGEATDLSLLADGRVQVVAEETLGQYAEWLQVSTSRLRMMNNLRYGQPLRLGAKLRLDFSRVERPEFERQRRAFHSALQSRFFDGRRIAGTEAYVVRRGDTLWSISQRFPGVPVWLLQQYNPDVDFGELRAGAQLVMPKIETLDP